MQVKSTIDEAIKDLERLSRAVLEESKPEIDAILEVVNEAQGRNIPVRTGKLLNSRFIERAEIKGNEVVGAVGAGKNGDPFYASIVHEIPGKPGHKFLENAATPEQGRLESRLNAAARRAAKKALG